SGPGLEHPLLQPRDEIKNVGFIAVTADRGLAGAYNASIIRTVERAVAERRSRGTGYSLVLAGKKAESYFRWRGYNVDYAGTCSRNTSRLACSQPCWRRPRPSRRPASGP